MPEVAKFRLLKDHDQAFRLGAVRDTMAQADREHATGLEIIRQTGSLTQDGLAKELRISQAAVQETEQRKHMLISTLRKYIHAARAHLERALA